MALEITDGVSVLTSSTSGPATFINDSDSMYTAHKPMEVDLHGIRLGQTEVEVYNQMRLRDVRTDFDGIPLVGPLVSNVARTQHDQKAPELSRELKEKVAAKVQTRIDTEANAKLGQVAKRLQEKVFAPLDVLALDPQWISAETTDRRVVGGFGWRARINWAATRRVRRPRPIAWSASNCTNR